jgi:hypothetical protein
MPAHPDDRERPTTPTVWAALVTSASGRIPLTGLLFAVGASISWASGSLYAWNAPLPRRPFVGIGMEMLCGGAGPLVAGVLGRRPRPDPSGAHLAGLGARGRLPHRVRIVRRIRVVRVVAAERSDAARLDVRVREPGRRGGPRVGVPRRVDLAPDGDRRRDRPGAVAIIVASREDSSPEATSGGELAEDRGDLGERDLSLEGAGDAQDHGLAERRRGDLQADG